MRTTMTLVLALVAGTAFGQYPYAIPPAWGYMNKNEAMRQQQFENQRWQREQREKEANYLWGGDPMEYAERGARIRMMKEQTRTLRLQNDYREKTGNFLIDNNPFR
jgi:hypothetical protein